MDDPADWLPRRLAPTLAEALGDTPVACLLGPRQSGKTTLARRAHPGRDYFSLDDAALRERATTDPAGFIAALPPVVTLDEIQRAPALLPAIKLAVDADRRPGRFLLTGSANLLLLPTVSESLAGRMEVVRLHPLTEAEKERAPGRLLEAFLAGELKPRVRSGHAAPALLVDRVSRGGFPAAVKRTQLARVRAWHRDYVGAIVERDARDVANLRDLGHLEALLTLVALQTAQLLNVDALARLLGIRRETVEHNLAALERLFLVRRLPAWHTSPARRLVKAPKVHVVDSGLVCTLGKLRPEDWLSGMDRFGHVLESFVVQQLVAQGGWTDPDLRFHHYRDKDQVEVDLVITRGRETWGVEVKSSSSVSSADGRGLRRLAEHCGRHFRGGMVLYGGASTFALWGDGMLAVPIAELWTR